VWAARYQLGSQTEPIPAALRASTNLLAHTQFNNLDPPLNNRWFIALMYQSTIFSIHKIKGTPELTLFKAPSSIFFASSWNEGENAVSHDGNTNDIVVYFLVTRCLLSLNRIDLGLRFINFAQTCCCAYRALPDP